MCVLLDCSLPGSSSVGFSRQEHWSRLPFPSLGDIPDPGIKHASPALQVDSLPLSHLWSPSKSLIPVTTQGYGGSGDGRQLNSISWRREYLYIYIFFFLRNCSSHSFERWDENTSKYQSNSKYSCKAGEGNGKPLQYSCLENPVDRGAWWAAVHWIAQSWHVRKRVWYTQTTLLRSASWSYSCSTYIHRNLQKFCGNNLIIYHLIKRMVLILKHIHAAAAAAKSLQSCPTLCDPMDCSLPGSSTHGARTLVWVAIAFSESIYIVHFKR